MQRSRKDTLLDTLPPAWPHDVLPAIRVAVAAADQSIVVIDDDPTGTQTVYDIPVLMEWTYEAIKQEFAAKEPLFYIQTNSRSCLPERAREIARQVGATLLEASVATGRRFTVISRSDSTLRGHFPAEVDALASTLGFQDAVRVIVPFFLEGGRYTINDIHWVEEDGECIPVGETPFAKDASFGYAASHLPGWVEEKTAGAVQASDVATVSIDTIRVHGPAGVKRQLMEVDPGGVCVLNAASMRDLEVATLGCLEAERDGKRLLYRTAASFVRTYAGLEERPLQTVTELQLPEKGAGLIIVGSHVPMSTRQLEHLLANTDTFAVEFNVARLLNPDSRTRAIRIAAEKIREGQHAGRDVVFYTSRRVLTGMSKADSLEIAGVVSSGIVDVLSHLDVKPRYIMAKGGITSSDVATRGLGVKRAVVLGQIIPGVPVNRLGKESRFPGLVYIVFPGNVGLVDSITNVVLRLSRSSHG